MNTVGIAAAILFIAATTAFATELKESKIEVSFLLPDGTSHSTVLTEDEVRPLVGDTDEFRVEWWIRAARVKLSIPAMLSCYPGGPEPKSVVSVSPRSKAPDDTWALFQPRHDLARIAVAYEHTKCQ